MDVTLTPEQKKAFETIWWIYGNNRRKCTPLNHKLVQGFYQYNEDRREPYAEAYENIKDRIGEEQARKHAPTKECIKVCGLILDNKIEEALKIAKV